MISVSRRGRYYVQAGRTCIGQKLANSIRCADRDADFGLVQVFSMLSQLEMLREQLGHVNLFRFKHLDLTVASVSD